MKNTLFKYLPIMLIMIFSFIGVGVSQNLSTNQSDLMEKVETITSEEVSEITLVKKEGKVVINDVLTTSGGYISSERVRDLNVNLEGSLHNHTGGPTP